MPAQMQLTDGGGRSKTSLADSIRDSLVSVVGQVGDYAGQLSGAIRDASTGKGSAPNPWGGASSSNASLGGGSGLRYGSGLYYGYGGIGGGDTGPSQNQKDAAANLGAIVGENADNLRDKFDNVMNNLDIADEQNQRLRDSNVLVARQGAGSDWFRQHLKLQRVASALNDRSGNATRGSFLYDYRDLLGAADDMIDAETLDTQRENVNQSLLGYYEALAQNVNARNEMAADTESGLRELYADYLAQLNNIHPDLVADKLDTKNHSVKPVDWLSTDFYGSHVTQAATPETQDLYRPDRANTAAVEGGTRGTDTSRASSAYRSYWDRMDRGYDQRTRQS